MSIIYNENYFKERMEEDIKSARWWVNWNKDYIKLRKNEIKNYKRFINNDPSNADYYKGLLQTTKQGLASDKEWLERNKKRLSELLEDYKNKYGKKETLTEKINKMGLRVIQGGLDSKKNKVVNLKI